MRSFTAQAVARKQIKLFSRHGIPKEVLTDQGTNFTSVLLAELYRMLGVRPLKTTPYHPQTDGVVKRCNQTLKRMLRKVVNEDGNNWDKLIPYILYAYQQVPQASTGFSPFELVYGRDLRRPLDVLKDGWTNTEGKEDDELNYVQRVYDTLKAAKDLVQTNMEKAQKKNRKLGMTKTLC